MSILGYLPTSMRVALKTRLRIADMEVRLANLARIGHKPKTIIDCGAYHGEWARLSRRIWPDVPVLLVEPIADNEAALQMFCRLYPDCQYKMAALWSEPSQVLFKKQGSNSRVLRSPTGDSAERDVQSIEAMTLDGLLSGSAFENPGLVKIDVQGSEMEVLAGAEKTLRSAEVLVVESSILPIGKARPFRELINLLHDRGYRLYDFVGHHYRPLDRALWQVDAVFVREDSRLVESRAWR